MSWTPQIVGGTDFIDPEAPPSPEPSDAPFKRIAQAYVQSNADIIGNTFPSGEFDILVLEVKSRQLRSKLNLSTRRMRQLGQVTPFVQWPGKATDPSVYLVTACCGYDQETLTYGRVAEYLATQCENYARGEDLPLPVPYAFSESDLFTGVERHSMALV